MTDLFHRMSLKRCFL